MEDLHWVDSETHSLLSHLLDGVASVRAGMLLTYRPEFLDIAGPGTRTARPSRWARSRAWARGLCWTRWSARTPPRRGQGPAGRAHRRQPVLPRGERAQSGGSRRARGRARTLPAGPRAAGGADPAEHSRGAGRAHRPARPRGQMDPPVRGGGRHHVHLGHPGSPRADPRPRAAPAPRPPERAGFVREANLFPDPEWAFRHALTHDVAYQGLLHDRRRVCTPRWPTPSRPATPISPLSVERLALHAFHGEQWERALRCLRQAGARRPPARPTSRPPPTSPRPRCPASPSSDEGDHWSRRWTWPSSCATRCSSPATCPACSRRWARQRRCGPARRRRAARPGRGHADQFALGGGRVRGRRRSGPADPGHRRQARRPRAPRRRQPVPRPGLSRPWSLLRRARRPRVQRGPTARATCHASLRYDESPEHRQLHVAGLVPRRAWGLWCGTGARQGRAADRPEHRGSVGQAGARFGIGLADLLQGSFPKALAALESGLASPAGSSCARGSPRWPPL